MLYLPGTSGVLTPFTEMESLYFDNNNEPDDWFYQFNKRMNEIYDKNGISYIKFDFDSANDFYNALESMRKVYDDVKIYGTSREGKCEIIIENESDDDDKSESTSDE